MLFIELFREGFDSNDFPKSKEPDIELLRCFTLLKERGFSIDFVDLKLGGIKEKDLLKRFSGVEYLFMNSKTYNRYFCLELIKKAKESSPGIKIFLYGQHPDSDPEFFFSAYDDIYIIRQEIYPFFEGFGKEAIEKLPNLMYKESGKTRTNSIVEIEDMDTLSPVDLDWMDDRYYTLYPMKTRRRHSWGFLTLTKGCPFECVFCSRTLRVSCGKVTRHFSPEESVKRIRRVIDDGHNFIRFLDDDWHDKDFIKSLCRALIAEDMDFRWMAQVRADSLDLRTLRLMKRAGCECLNIGVESGSEPVLERLKKGETLKDIRKAFSLCKKLGIYTVAYFMIGNPDESEEDLEKSFELIQELKPTMLQVAYFTPYPGSPFFDKLPESSKLETNFFHYENIVYNFSKIDSEILRKTMKRWNLRFYMHPKNFMRLSIFRMACLFSNPRRELSIWWSIFRSFFSSRSSSSQ